MLSKLKNWLYFPLASYFRFFAQIRLKRWKPRIILVTGSSGKTTTLHLLESQIGDKARYSHHANSSYGIPFNILGLERKETLLREWPLLFLLTPIKALLPPPKEKIYVVEADCDRPHEGQFLTQLLKPEVTLWLSLSKTHAMNFDRLVKKGRFASIKKAIAFEFGFFIQSATAKVFANGDNPHILSQLKRTKAQVELVTKKEFLDKYQLYKDKTEFVIKGQKFTFPYLLPEETIYGLSMCFLVLIYLKMRLDKSFAKFRLPPGRSSIFRGVKQTTIIDSTYNANLDSVLAILNLFAAYPAKKKWLILGDMLELGKEEAAEHLKLAHSLAKMKVDRIILMGPRLSEYTYPQLKSVIKKNVVLEKFLQPREVLDYLQASLEGGESLLFKGARFLEGVIENLLEDKSQARNLPRREKYWEKWRKKWGLTS